MKGIVCECGSIRWRVLWRRSQAGLRRRRLECSSCKRRIFTEEKEKVSQGSSTSVITPNKPDVNKSGDC